MRKPTETCSTRLHIQELLKADSSRALLGTLKRLILTLYAPLSAYDVQIHQIIYQHRVVCSKEFVPPDTLIHDLDPISGSIGCRASPELSILEPLLECCNASTGRAQSIKRKNGTFCSPCGAGLDAKSQIQ